MAYDRKLELRQIKKLSIVKFLSDFGYEPTRISGGRAWYLSPFREESVPSFVVYLKEEPWNDWFDYGLGEGSTIIDLAMKLLKIDYLGAVAMLRREI